MRRRRQWHTDSRVELPSTSYFTLISVQQRLMSLERCGLPDPATTKEARVRPGHTLRPQVRKPAGAHSHARKGYAAEISMTVSEPRSWDYRHTRLEQPKRWNLPNCASIDICGPAGAVDRICHRRQSETSPVLDAANSVSANTPFLIHHSPRTRTQFVQAICGDLRLP